MSRIEQISDMKVQPLNKNAYLDAEALFRKTGDIRYLVISIGKPKSSHAMKEDDRIQPWALAACQEYAEAISSLSHMDRSKVKHCFENPQHSQRRYQVFLEAMELTRNEKRDKNGKVLSFTQNCKSLGVAEDEIRTFTGWRKTQSRKNATVEYYEGHDGERHYSEFEENIDRYSEERFLAKFGKMPTPTTEK